MGTMSTMQPRRARRALALVAAAGLLAAACSDDGGSSSTPSTAGGGTPIPDDVGIVGGTQELTVVGVEAGEPVTLQTEEGDDLLTMLADDAGQAHFAYVPTEHLTVDSRTTHTPPTADGGSLKPGSYLVALGEGDDRTVSEPIEVRAVDDVPDQAFYDEQVIEGIEVPILGPLPEGVSVEDGYGYIEARDGTMLSAMARYPDTRLYGEGPWPTIVEMEGYSASNPNGEPPGAMIARSLGFATVAVNIRGTGCSGGVFDVFNPSQQSDAYDVVEAVAAQDWVKGNKVGVIGLSYSGIMAMYTGAMNPPHLAAMAPQSVIPDPWGHQWPGGMYNAGFTKQWLDERDRQSAVGGSNWVSERVDAGIDSICEENMSLRSQNIDFEQFGKLLEARPTDEDERDLRRLAANVEVPVLLTGAFQDEQTGPLWTDLINRFDNAPIVRVAMWNGRHPDGYTPMNIMDWYEFLQLYVNEEVPKLPDIVLAGAPEQFAGNFDLEDVTLPGNRLYDEFGDDYEAALAFYESEDPIRVVLESGFGENELGEPGGTVDLRFPSWPVPGTEEVELFLAGDGTLADEAPAESSVEQYQHDPDALGLDFFADGYPLFDRLWDFDWTEYPEGRSLTYLTDPFEEDVVLAGASALKLFFGSDAPEVDVQVTISEVRPDGVEYQLQNGYLRMGHRAIDEDASEGLRVVQSLAVEDFEPLPEGEMVEATIGIAPVFAPIRAGSQLRIQIATPGRNHGTWIWEDLYEDDESPTHRVGLGGDTPSSFSITLLRGVEVPPELPPCPSLRGQACRTFAATTNEAG